MCYYLNVQFQGQRVNRIQVDDIIIVNDDQQDATILAFGVMDEMELRVCCV